MTYWIDFPSPTHLLLKYWYKCFASLSLSSYMQHKGHYAEDMQSYFSCSALPNMLCWAHQQVGHCSRICKNGVDSAPSSPALPCWSYSFLSCETQIPKTNKLLLSSSSWYLEKFKNVPRHRGTSAPPPVLTSLTYTSLRPQRTEALICKQSMLYICMAALVDEGRRLTPNIICWILKPLLDFNWIDSLEVRKSAKKPNFSYPAYNSRLFFNINLVFLIHLLCPKPDFVPSTCDLIVKSHPCVWFHIWQHPANSYNLE